MVRPKHPGRKDRPTHLQSTTYEGDVSGDWFVTAELAQYYQWQRLRRIRQWKR